MFNPAWLSDDVEPSTATHVVAKPPAAATTSSAPNWFDDDADAPQQGKAPRRTPRGGEEISMEPAAVATRTAPPTAFLERMKAFEQQRQQKQEAPVPQPPPRPPAQPADNSRPSPRLARQSAHGNSASPSHSPEVVTPTTSSLTTTPSSAMRPSASPAAIGIDVGLSDASATKPVSLDDFTPLTDDERRQFADEVLVWGADTIARSRASSFQLRLAAVEHIASAFEGIYSTLANKALNAAFDTVGRLVGDTVPKVSIAACTVLQNIVSQALFIMDESIPRLALGVDAACNRLKDTNSKVREAASQLLLQLALHDSIGPVTIVDSICGISHHESQKLSATLSSLNTTRGDGSDFASTLTSAASTLGGKASQALLGNWKEVVHRLELCQTFVRLHPQVCHACQEGIMALALAGLNSSNSKVRRSAIIFTADVYKVNGPAEMEPYFTRINAPATLKLLRDEIQAVCGGHGAASSTDEGGNLGAGDVVESVLEERADIAAFEASGVVLTEEQQGTVQFWRTAFDFSSMVCMFSTTWKLRARVLGRVRGALVSKATNASSEHVATVLSQLLALALDDSVPTVLAAAIDLTFVIADSPLLPPGLLLTFATPLVLSVLKQVAGQQSAASRPWDILISILRNGGRDAPARVTTVVTRADAGAISKVTAKVMVPRVEIVTVIVDQCGSDLDALGVSADAVLTFAVECLRHSQHKVRAVAVELVMAVYRAAGNIVQHHLSGLDGKILEEIKSRIAAIAKKERSRTAPAHRLATIVAPMAELSLGDVTPEASPNGSLRQTRPNTTAPALTGVEFTRTNGSSLRQRMALWREVQRGEESGEASPTAHSPSPPSKPRGESAPVTTEGSPILRPPAVRKGLVFA